MMTVDGFMMKVENEKEHYLFLDSAVSSPKKCETFLRQYYLFSKIDFTTFFVGAAFHPDPFILSV